MQEPLLGYATAGIYGYTHAFGGYAGSHAQCVRVPFADVGCFEVPDDVSDDQALFLSDAAPTGFMGADFCSIQPGDTVAVMGMRRRWPDGAEERVPARRRARHRHRPSAGTAARGARADRIRTLNYSEVHSIPDALKELTGGRGPDSCVDCVGMEAHGTGPQYAYDRVKQALRLQTDRGQALREASS